MNISVIISSYNKRDTLARAITSAASQSLQPSEIVVCEDRSLDGSASIVRRLQATIPQLRMIEYPAKSANWLQDYFIHTANLTGDYIHHLSADDYVLPGFYEACEAGQGAGIIAGCSRVVLRNGQQQSANLYRLTPGLHYLTTELYNWLTSTSTMPGGVPMLMSREVARWLIATDAYRLGPKIDSIGQAAAMWPFGFYYLNAIWGVWEYDDHNYGGAKRPRSLKESELSGGQAWLEHPLVQERVPEDLRAAFLEKIKQNVA